MTLSVNWLTTEEKKTNKSHESEMRVELEIAESKKHSGNLGLPENLINLIL